MRFALNKGEKERRVRPRQAVQFASISVTTEMDCPMINLSASGVSFSSERTFQQGQRIQLTLTQVISVDAVVLDCTLEVKNSLFMEAHYRVRCRFEGEATGERLLRLVETFT